MIHFLMESKNRNFLRLWLAQLISQFGDRITQLALVGLIAERSPGNAMALAKLLAFTIIPVFIIQPFAGALVDRWDRRTTLFVCDISRGLLILTIPFIFIFNKTVIMPIYIIVFLAFCFSRFYVPAKMSIIPDLVEESKLLQANSLVTTTGMIAFVLGLALGGLLIEQFGARNGFIVDAATFFVSAALLFTMDIPKRLKFNKDKWLDTKALVRQTHRSTLRDIKEGIIYLVNQKEIRFIIMMLFTLLAAAGAIYVVLIVFIQKSFHSVTMDIGFLGVCLGFGLFCGTILYGKWGNRYIWYKTIFFCLGFGGTMLVLFAIYVHYYPNIFAAMFLAIILGLIVGPIFIASNTMTHIFSNEEMRGRVFSALEIVIHFAFLMAMLLSSWLSDFVQEVWILVTVGGIVALIGLWGLIRNWTIGADPVPQKT
jgi:MFS transporter, DHA3 family, macrolide efflux protein